MPNELQEKVNRYRQLTKEALNKVEIIVPEGTKEFQIAADFLSMAKNYFSDAGYFEKKGDLINALAAYSYAHAWLDAGVRAKVFDGKYDDRLFTLP